LCTGILLETVLAEIWVRLIDFYSKINDHEGTKVKTPQQSEKRFEGPRKKSRASSVVRLEKLETTKAGKSRKGRKFPI
jgi:hypothetical protein